MNVGWQVLWVACGVATVVAAGRALRRRWARYLGRAAVGVLFTAGGALVHVVNLVTHQDYVGFADPAHFAWVTHAWRTVVGPHQVVYIGLLAAFEAAVGTLVLSGGRRTRLGYLGVIGFYLALWLFGWFETVWCLAMLPPMVVLLVAERRTPAAVTPRPPVVPVAAAPPV